QLCDARQRLVPLLRLDAARRRRARHVRLLGRDDRGTHLVITACVSTLPGTQTRALWTLALFAAIPLADGALTPAGIAQFGPHIEGNPLIDVVAGAVGIGGAIIGAKVIAIFGGTVLYLQARHLALALLSVGYVAAAILPWMIVLSVR